MRNDVAGARLAASAWCGEWLSGLLAGSRGWLPTLLTMSAGLGTSVMAGQSSAGQAQAVIDYHLHRLFPGSVSRGGQ